MVNISQKWEQKYLKNEQIFVYVFSLILYKKTHHLGLINTDPSTQLNYLLNLRKLQKPEAGEDCRKNQNLIFNSTKPRRKQNKKIRTSLLPKLQKNYNTLVPYLLQFSVAKLTTCITSSGISSVTHHNRYINVFVVYVLMQDIFADKIHFFKFLSMTDKPWLDQ